MELIRSISNLVSAFRSREKLSIAELETIIIYGEPGLKPEESVRLRQQLRGARVEAGMGLRRRRKPL